MMMRIRLYHILPVILLAGCGFMKPVQQPTMIPVPTAFDQGTDTVSSANISWRNFFGDKKLVQYIDTALQHNPDLLAITQEVEIAKANLRFSKGQLFPAVSFAGSAGRERYSHYTSDYAGNSTAEIIPGKTIPNPLPDYALGLQLSWEADVTGKLRNMKRAAAARYLASEEGRNWAVTNLVAEVSSTYYELLALYNAASIIDSTIALQQSALDLIRIQKDAGRANELAVKQAEAELLSSQSLRLQNRQQVTETENYFNLLEGRFPGPLSLDTAQVTGNTPPLVRTGIPSQMLSNRPDIRQAEYELEASRADVKAARAAFYPSLNITAGAGFNAFHTQYLFTTPEAVAWNVVGNLTAPLVNRSAIEASFRSARAGQLQAFYRYQKSILSGFVDVRNELSAVQNLQQENTLKMAEVSARNESVETSTELFKTGRATYLEVILAQQNALQSKLDLVEVKKQLFLSSVNMYKALGGGWR